MPVKISSRAKALLSFLSQFSEPFDIKDALNCSADVELGHPYTWSDSVDKWGIFRELYFSDFIELTGTKNMLITNAAQSGERATVSRHYMYTVTNKGREALVNRPFISKVFHLLYHSAPVVHTSKSPILARISSNPKYFIK